MAFSNTPSFIACFSQTLISGTVEFKAINACILDISFASIATLTEQEQTSIGTITGTTACLINL